MPDLPLRETIAQVAARAAEIKPIRVGGQPVVQPVNPADAKAREYESDMQAHHDVGAVLQRSGFPLPGPNDPTSENVIDRRHPIYTRAPSHEAARLRNMFGEASKP